MMYENLSDVLEWIKGLPVSQADTSPAVLYLQGNMPEDMFDEICAVVASQCWQPIESLTPMLTGHDAFYQGDFLMCSESNGVQKVSYGYDDPDAPLHKPVWLFADGMTMDDPTHWMFLPQPPRKT